MYLFRFLYLDISVGLFGEKSYKYVQAFYKLQANINRLAC